MTAQKKVLGRGLGALIPQKDDRTASATEVDVERIDASPVQPRKTFVEAPLEELAQSIRSHGVVQPLLVSRVANGRFQLIAGERRLRAARKAGLRSVPVVIKDNVSGRDALELALIENIQRQDLNPLEEALAYQQLHHEFGLTQDEIAKRVGKERSTVANLLRLLRLPESVKRMVAGGELSMGHARALLALENRGKMEQLAETVVRRGLNVRQTELLVSGGGRKAARPEKRKDVFTRDAEEKLTRIFRTKIEIDRKRRGGSIRIHFSDEEELMRLFEQISGRKR
jgi:ParB family transcriptional regulator, chromosome partitioning protein